MRDYTGVLFARKRRKRPDLDLFLRLGQQHMQRIEAICRPHIILTRQRIPTQGWPRGGVAASTLRNPRLEIIIDQMTSYTELVPHLANV